MTPTHAEHTARIQAEVDRRGSAYLAAEPAAEAPASDFADLCQGDDARFVRRLYLTLLRREPDASGAQAQCAALAQGISREDLARAIIESDEGRRAGVQLPGLNQPHPPRPAPPPAVSCCSFWSSVLRLCGLKRGT